jgi:hypothetical protein
MRRTEPHLKCTPASNTGATIVDRARVSIQGLSGGGQKGQSGGQNA